MIKYSIYFHTGGNIYDALDLGLLKKFNSFNSIEEAWQAIDTFADPNYVNGKGRKYVILPTFIFYDDFKG